MLYIKITDNDNIVAVESLEPPIYVEYSLRSKCYLCCSKTKAQGIVSANQELIYQLKGKNPLPDTHLVAEVIYEDEYEYLLTQLELPEQPEQPEPDPVEEPVSEADSSIMTAMQMRERIIDLEQQVAEKSEQISFLEDCLLEMSEIIYE